jgi:aminoglycoside phosphotransferase (APT) family kinase protein
MAPSSELLDVLRGYLAGGERITGIRALTFGHSNQTYLLEGLDRILRAPPVGAPLLPDQDMGHQHRVMRDVAAAPAGPPVPEVFELCEDPSVAGFPFLVMARCDGDSTDWKPPAWMEDGGAELRESLSAQWIAAVTQIHALPVSETWGARSPEQDAARWLGLIRAKDAPDRLVRMLDDLAERPGPASGDPTPLHGDLKFANFLWAGGQLQAVLDWEMATVGEPLTDLGYLLGLWPVRDGEPGQMPYTQLPGWWSRARIISGWETATGRTAEGIERHERLGMAKIAAIFTLGIHLYATGASDDARLARWPRSLSLWLDLIDRRAAVAA